MLAGEGLLIVEVQERPLKQWDFVHPCVIFCASSRRFQKDGPWGF